MSGDDTSEPDSGDADRGDAAGDADDTAEQPRWQSDLRTLLLLVVATYVGFGLIGVGTGVRLNSIAGFLQTVTFFAGVFALLTLAVNLHWGYTGLFNIGVAGFMGVGVYTMAVLTAEPTATPAGLGLPTAIGVIGGTIAAGLVGVVIALPALRVRADYFAIITLGFSEIVRLGVTSSALRQIEIGGRVYGTGGGGGIGYQPVSSVVTWLLELPGVSAVGDGLYAAATLLGLSASIVDRVLYVLVIIGFVLLFYLLLERIAHSPFGRVLKAIREDETAARSLGKDTRRAKLTVFALGAALMGLAGILWIGSRSLTTPSSFVPVVTFYIFVALIIGGSGSNTGSVVGAFVFAAFLWEGPRFIRTILRTRLNIDSPTTVVDAVGQLAALDPLPLVGYVVDSLDVLRWVVIGVLLIVLMVRRPEGLYGGRTDIAAATDLSIRPTRGDDDE